MAQVLRDPGPRLADLSLIAPGWRNRPHAEKRTVEGSPALLSLPAESNDLPILKELKLRKQVVARARAPASALAVLR
jgi:hypothetical protein